MIFKLVLQTAGVGSAAHSGAAKNDDKAGESSRALASERVPRHVWREDKGSSVQANAKTLVLALPPRKGSRAQVLTLRSNQSLIDLPPAPE
jgi:hypothetical protein